ncbi:MAG: polysaccharide deacetylase family protein [Ketobacteraceae bacterium]|nr:polysaccharide deacetylase family protein [Ketobacteraceae bacterium]
MNTTPVKSWLGHLAGLTVLPHLLRQRTAIFTFHRVLTEADYRHCHFQRSIVVTDTGLARFIDQLRRHFRIVPLSGLITGAGNNGLDKTGDSQPQAVITFDDGWRDNYEVALPVLESRQVPATIFISTDYIESPLGFWWQHLGDMLSDPAHQGDVKKSLVQPLADLLQQDPSNIEPRLNNTDRFIEFVKKHYYEQVPDIIELIASITHTELASHGLTWAQCQEMSAAGIEFGSHTLSHPRLSLLSGNALERELKESKQCLLSRSLNYVNAVCYPYGDYNDQTLEQAASFYDLGLTTNTGIIRQRNLPGMALPRINVSEDLTRNPGWLRYRLLKAALKGN